METDCAMPSKQGQCLSRMTQSSSALIKPLPESVVSRIAAGEIIHRPSHALKELLENALDADATAISIIIKDGGLSKILITDNGSGVHPEDLPILCQRFTTSKLKEFRDLFTLNSYGFRGEALASISHVASLSVVTKRKDAILAYKASYTDGQLVAGHPKPCAGNQGTLMLVENLFYNCPTKKNSMKTSSEEYGKILEMVSLYAIHRSGISISCKKEENSHYDLQTSLNATVLENIKGIYGEALAKELLRMTGDVMDAGCSPLAPFKYDGYVTHSGYHSKKSIFILFVNARLVESKSIKHAMTSLYASLLPKKSHPFIYLSLSLRPDHLDVNVHPTKQEVYMLHEEEIIKVLLDAAQRALSTSSSKSFHVLTSSSLAINDAVCADNKAGSQPPSHSMVRTDVKSQSLLAFKDFNSHESPLHAPPMKRLREDINLKSIHELKNALVDRCDAVTKELLQSHIFVGLMDYPLALIQHRTSLYMINYDQLSRAFFYENILNEFSQLQAFNLAKPICLRDATKLCPEWNGDSINRLAQLVAKFKDMLSDYFSIVISEDQNDVQSLPIVLNFPSLDLASRSVHVPSQFLHDLANKVNWDDERECLHGITSSLADFYKSLMQASMRDKDDTTKEAMKKWIQYKMFPCMKSDAWFHPPPGQDTEEIQHMTDLRDLYKVFERC